MTNEQIEKLHRDIDRLSYIRLYLYSGVTIYLNEKISSKQKDEYFSHYFLKKKVEKVVAEKSNYIGHINRPITVTY